MCLKHHNDDDVVVDEDYDDSAEDVTDTLKCSGFLEGFFLLIRMWRNFKNTGCSFNQLEPHMLLIQSIRSAGKGSTLFVAGTFFFPRQ